MNLNKLSTIVAYQHMRLLELEKEALNYEYYLKEVRLNLAKVDNDIFFLKKETENLDKFLLDNFGIDIKDFEDPKGVSKVSTEKKIFQKKYYQNKTFSLNKLYEEASNYLKQKNIDLTKDPLLQVLPDEFIEKVLKNYDEKFWNISWFKFDYIVVGIAAIIAIILDFVVVRTPEKAKIKFFGKKFDIEGSPLTKWIKEQSKILYEKYGINLEQYAQVSYDGSTNIKSNGCSFYSDKIEGLHPKVHRLMSLGHDPIIGIIVGVLDIYLNKATFFDKYGNLIKTNPLNSEKYQISLIEAFIKFFVHLISDIGTEKGIPAPLFSLIQGFKMKSPFALRENGEKVTWTSVARYMYTHGYDFRHFVSMGIVPATVEIIIRGYWLLSNWGEDKDILKLKAVKLSSMRLVSHSLVASGNLVKTGIIFQMNPLALNYTEIFFLVKSFIKWIYDSVQRNKKIEEILLKNWEELYKDSINLSY